MIELAVVFRVGGAPLILARLRDDGLVRQAIGKAIVNAERRAAIDSDPFAAAGAEQEAQILRGLLDYVGESQLVM